MANHSTDFMKDVLASPLGDLITSIGEGVAQAQAALDAGSLAQTLKIYSENDEPGMKMLRDIGYQPTFYALPETEVEAKVALSISNMGHQNSASEAHSPHETGKTKVYAAPLNPGLTNRYNMNANASATLRFKIVPVPPSNQISETRVVPNLIGKTEAEVQALLVQLQLEYSIEKDSESGKVITQSPAPGELTQIGNPIVIEL